MQNKHAVIVKKRAEEAEKQWEQQFKIFIAAAPIV